MKSTATIAPGHGVKARRKHDGVELERVRGGVDARRGDRGDRRRPQIDQPHMRQVERLVVVRVEARPLRAVEVVLRTQRLGGHRIAHDRSNLVAQELAEQLVGRRVEQGIGEKRRNEIARFPHAPRRARGALPPRPAAHPSGSCGTGTPSRERRAASRYAAAIAPIRVEPFLGDRAVLRGPAEVGRALKHRERGRLRGDVRNALNARRSRADHGHPLAGEIDALVRPARREIHLALEVVDAGNVGAFGTDRQPLAITT